MSYIGRSQGFGIRSRYYYTATAAQTTFSGADDNGQTLAYADSKYLDVFLNGVLLVAGTDYTATTLTSVTLTSGASASDIIEIVAYDIFSVADTVSAANGGTFSGAVTFDAGLNTDTISEETSATGVTIDGVLLKDGEVTVTDKIIHAGDTNTAIRFPAADTVTVETGGSERVRIDSSGNVGIGTSSPSGELHIKSASGTTSQLIVDNSNASDESRVLFYNNGSAQWRVGVDSTPNMVFTRPGVLEAMRIDSSGSLLVGRTSLGGNETLSLQNSNNVSGDFSIVSFLGSNCNNTSSYHYIGSTGGADKIYIHGNGNIVNVNNSYGSLSDIKIKENITDATPKLDSLNQVRVVNYNLKDNPDQKLLGVVAQELEEIFPSMVDESPDRDTDGNILDTTTKSVKYSVFVPILIKALQEAVARIETLEAEVAALKGETP